jgi:hypothetical protein
MIRFSGVAVVPDEIDTLQPRGSEQCNKRSQLTSTGISGHDG